MRYVGHQPFKCLRRWLGQCVACLIYVSMFLVIPATGCWLYGQWVLEEPGLLSVVLFLLCAAAVVLFGWYGLLRNIKEGFVCRIVPYFESRVATYPESQPDAFSTGVHLARRCRFLDERAVEAGVPPLSSFGFRDDRDGQKLTWHPVPDGLRTVDALIAVTQNVADEAGLHDDLLRLQQYPEESGAKGGSILPHCPGWHGQDDLSGRDG